jgi:hypothetical protein
LSNIKEDVGTNPGVCPYYGKNKWPSAQFKETVLAVNQRMFRSAMLVMRGCDALIEEDRVQHGRGPLEEGRLTFVEIAERGTTLAGRWIWYDSAFSRDDTLLEEKKQADEMAAATSSMDNSPPATATTTTTASHTTPSLLVGHNDDAMASMRTHATAIRSSGAAAAFSSLSSSSSSSSSSLSVGHENDEMASMRTHATAIRTSGASSSSLSVGHENDEMASMRTHATAIRTSGATSSTPPLPSPHVGHEDDEMASMRTHATAIRSSGANTANTAACKPASDEAEASRQEFGDYWLPWHIDSQFITLLTSDEYRSEATGRRVSPEEERQHRTNGLVVMNKRGDVVSVAPQIDDKTMLVQMGGFAQIFSGGLLRSCRHAVSRHTARCVRGGGGCGGGAGLGC